MDNNKTIVIADPGPEFRIGLKSFLAKKGYRIVGDCQDGYEALRIIEETKPDSRGWSPAPYHGSRAMTRSPSPLAWRPDFPGAPREAH